MEASDVGRKRKRYICIQHTGAYKITGADPDNLMLADTTMITVGRKFWADAMTPAEERHAEHDVLGLITPFALYRNEHEAIPILYVSEGVFKHCFTDG